MDPVLFAEKMEVIRERLSHPEAPTSELKDQACALVVQALTKAGYGSGATCFADIMKAYA
jgi:hypothetical protein